jgi:hypothetical protein
MTTSNDTKKVGEVAGSTSSNQGFNWLKLVLPAIILGIIVALAVCFWPWHGNTGQDPAPAPGSTVVSESCPHVDMPQATNVGPEYGGIFTADYKDLAIPLVDGKPNLDANKYPVSSQEAKEKYFHAYCSSAMLLYTFTENHHDMLGFNSGVENVGQLIEQRDDGKWYYNASGKELLIKLHEFIFRNDVGVRIVWIDQALASTLSNANNNGSWASFSPLAYEPDKGMTAWEVTLYGTDDSGNQVVVATARQLTRCGNLTPPTNPDEPKVKQKEPIPIRQNGDDNFRGSDKNTGNPGRSDKDEPSAGNGSNTTQTGPGNKPGDPITGGSSGGGVTAPGATDDTKDRVIPPTQPGVDPGKVNDGSAGDAGCI